MKTFKTLTYAIYAVLLFWATLTIFLRRWAWDQVATQVPVWLIYVTFAVNLLVAGYCVYRIVRRERQGG